MALPTSISQFETLFPVSTGVDATAGDKVLVDAADIPSSKRVAVMGFSCCANAPQVFEVKSSGGTVKHRVHITAASGNNKSAHHGGEIPMFVLPADEGLTVNFANAVAGSNFNAMVRVIDA